MKKITTFLLLLCAALFGATTASAETIKLTTSNGLPGQLSNGQYTFESDALTAKTPFKYMRLTFFDTYGHNTHADNFKFVCLSEFYLEDANGTEIPLTVDNFSTNAQQSNEGPMANICDDNTESTNYWHSSWSSAIGEYHYLQIALPESMDPISSYKLKWITRNQNNSPISLAVTTAATAEELTNEVKNYQWTEDNGHVFKLLQSGNGLPGTQGQTSVSGQYSWTSDLLTYDNPVNKLVFRVLGTNTQARFGNYPFFTLSEFKVYDENGTQVTLTTDNFECNAVHDGDGQGIAGVCDNDNNTYLHTRYSGTNPNTYHYLKVILPTAMSKFKIAFDSRNQNNVPKCVELEAYSDAANGYTSIDEGVYRIVSANSNWANSLKAITGSLRGNSCSAGWEGVDVNDPEQYWTIAGNETDGYTLQNTHFGDKKYLTTDNSGQAKTSSLTNNGTSYKFYYLGDGQYNIFPNGSEYPLHCANQADNYSESTLTTWKAGANTASAWTLVKSTELEASRISVNSALSGVSTSASVADNAIGTNPGQVNTDMSLDDLKAAVTARNNAATTATTAVAGTDVEAMGTAYTALVSAKAAVPAANAIEANKYYRLKGDKTGNYAVAVNPGETHLLTAALSDDNKASTIFYLDDNKLLSYSNGYYVYQTCEMGALGKSCTWTFSPSDSKLGTMTLQAVGNINGAGVWMYDNPNGSKVDRNSTLANDFTNWYIEPVDELPVSISAARYATIFAPVALSIPTGVEAYAADFTDGKVMLSPVEGGIIPANTGVVLEGEEGTHNFPITAPTDATVTSALSGNKATAAVADDATAYILAKGAQGVGFYKLNSTDRTIQGGRAFYTVPASTENAVAFIFGGEVTDINNAAITDAQSNAPIFDLTGRKVAKAVKGGLYIQNGRKFIVK